MDINVHLHTVIAIVIQEVVNGVTHDVDSSIDQHQHRLRCLVDVIDDIAYSVNTDCRFDSSYVCEGSSKRNFSPFRYALRHLYLLARSQTRDGENWR